MLDVLNLIGFALAAVIILALVLREVVAMVKEEVSIFRGLLRKMLGKPPEPGSRLDRSG